MTRKISDFCIFLFIFCAVMFVGADVHATTPAQGSSTTGDLLVGTWHGTFSSRNFASFPVTLVINRGVGTKLTGAVTLGSPCLRDANLQVRINKSQVVLAGGDKQGNTVTLNGTIDSGGTQLTMTYVINGSASGRCETDDGSGTLDKQ